MTVPMGYVTASPHGKPSHPALQWIFRGPDAML